MNKKQPPKIWVLTDHRTGNSAQAIALAEKLGLEFEIKHLEYNFLAQLPNFLLANSAIYITSGTKKSLETTNPPKLIIAAGRRAAGIASYLKKRYPDVKLVQIMKPDMNTDIFDLIAIPQHDTFKDAKSNVIRTIGALNNISTRIANYSKPPAMKDFIGVLIGGNTKEYRFTKQDATNLSRIIDRMVEHNAMPAFITFSRRTPEDVKKVFIEMFPSPNIIYDPTIADKENPYLEILKYSTFLIITCDSVSMCSEAASTGIPLYIYVPEQFHSQKHKYFTQQLVDLKVARILEDVIYRLEKYQYSPLNEVEKIAKIVKDEVLE